MKMIEPINFANELIQTHGHVDNLGVRYITIRSMGIHTEVLCHARENKLGVRTAVVTYLRRRRNYVNSLCNQVENEL